MSAATTCSAAAWRLALRSVAVAAVRPVAVLAQAHTCWARQRLSPSVGRARRLPRRALPSRAAACSATVWRLALRSLRRRGAPSLSRRLFRWARQCLSPSVGSPLPSATRAASRAAALSAATTRSTAAWRFALRPAAVAAVHPVAAPATGTRLADLSPSAGLRLWRLKPNAVARLSHPPAVPKALGGSPGMRRKASNPVCSEACSPEGNVSKVPLGTLAAPVRLSEAGRARNLRTLEAPAPNATDARGTAQGRRMGTKGLRPWSIAQRAPALVVWD